MDRISKSAELIQDPAPAKKTRLVQGGMRGKGLENGRAVLRIGYGS